MLLYQYSFQSPLWRLLSENVSRRVKFSRDWLFFWRWQSRLPGHIRITELQTPIMHCWPSSDCNKLLLLLVDSTTKIVEGKNFLRKILTWECQRSPLLEWAKLVLKVFSLRGMFARSGPFQSWPEMCRDVYLLLQTCIYFRQPCSQPILEMWRPIFERLKSRLMLKVPFST